MTDMVNIILQVFTWIGSTVMTIQIAGMPLITWLLTILIITAVVSFVFNNAQNAQKPEIKHKRKEKEE